MSILITNKINRRKLIKIIAFSAIGSTSYGMYNLFGNKEYIKSKWTGTVLNNNVSLEIHSNAGKICALRVCKSHVVWKKNSNLGFVTKESRNRENDAN